MFSRFCQLLPNIASNWPSRLVVKAGRQGFRHGFVKTVVIASPSASSVSIFDNFHYLTLLYILL